VNGAKSQVMKVRRRENGDDLDFTLNSTRIEEVNCFRYLGVDIEIDDDLTSEI
jgi:hypothetical protein